MRIRGRNTEPGRLRNELILSLADGLPLEFECELSRSALRSDDETAIKLNNAPTSQPRTTHRISLNQSEAILLDGHKNDYPCHKRNSYV